MGLAIDTSSSECQFLLSPEMIDEAKNALVGLSLDLDHSRPFYGRPCKMTMCEAIGEWLDALAHMGSVTTYRKFTSIAYYCADFVDKGAKIIARRFEQQALVSGKPADDYDRACGCYGFNDDVEYNSWNNARHYVAVLYWSDIGRIGNNLENMTKMLNATTRRRQLEVAAQSRANVIALEAHDTIRTPLVKGTNFFLNPWDNPTAWTNSRSMIKSEWLSRFCKKK